MTGQRVILGEGTVGRVRDLLASLCARRVFLVFDAPAYEHSGAAAALSGVLGGYRTSGFSEFEPNPKLEDAVIGVARFREDPPDVVIAVGGGSALDMAKVIAVCGVQEAPLLEYVTGRLQPERPGPPVIALPTTAGTGSEATHFAVVYVDGRKHSLAHPFLRPRYALIDPALTYSVPPGLTAASGLDALAQAMESIWATGATADSMNHASEALSLALAFLEEAVHRPTPAARLGMARAAHLAGKAIDISKTTAPHAVSYAITTRFGVPHGAAVALTLGAFLHYNSAVDDSTCNDPRGAGAVRDRVHRVLKLVGEHSPEAAEERIQALVERVGCPVRLGQVGVRRDDLPELARAVNLERLSNNPRSIDTGGLISLLESVL
jgi:alcohol dehydrogenase